MKAYYRKQKTSGSKAQAIVEFAIVLPILMMMLVGIFEVGRLLFIYAAVNNASREAARFASALGYDDDGYHKYKHCEGIRNMAQRSAYFTPLTITISYDQGPTYSPFAWCDAISGEDNDFTVTTNDRVQVTVIAHYKPLINLVPIPERDITSTSARTILGFVEVGQSPSSGSGSGFGYTSTPTSAAASTATSTATVTITDTPTKTATLGPLQPTFTPLPSSTPTIVLTSTNTATPTLTRTSTPTMTLTPTPTNTPTAVSSCSSITTSDISMATNSSVISMTITNPYISVTVSSIQLIWNAASGGPGNNTLTLDSANLGTTFWSGLNNSSGNITLTPSSTLTIPGNNTTSTITFTFNKNYQHPITNGTTITINLSTPGCNAITKTK